MDLPPIQPQNTMKRSSNSPDKKKSSSGDYAPSPPSPTRRRASFEAASVLANLGLSSSRDASSPTIATTTKATTSTDDSKLPSTNSTSTKHKYKSSPPRNDVPMTFPEKLMELLANDEYSDVVTWLPHGKGFAILKKEEFQNDVLPLYFKQSKYTSFTRKLKRWGFTRVTAGTELGAYYHKFFQRDDHLLCMQMQCQSTGPLVFNKDLHRQNKMLLAEKRKFAKMHRTSTSSQEDTDTKSSDDIDVASSSRINGLRGESEEDRDGLLGQVLQRQRELLKQEDAMFGEGSGFDSVLEKQQQLLRAQINTSRLKREEEEMRNTNEQSAMISLRREQLRREQLLREQANNNSYHRPFQEQGSYLPRPNNMMYTDQRPMPSDRGIMNAGSATLRDPQAEALLGAISNSRHHRHIMENALNALKSGQSLPPAMNNPVYNLAMENAHNTSLFGSHGAPRRNYVDLTNGESSSAAASSYPRPPSQQSHYLEREKWQTSFDDKRMNMKEEFLKVCAARDAQYAMEAAKAKMRMQLQGGMNESRYGGGMDLNHNTNMNAQAQLLRLARHNKSVEDALALIGKSAIHKDDNKDEEKERSPFSRAA